MWGGILGASSLGAVIAFIGIGSAIGSLHFLRSVYRGIRKIVNKAKGE